MCPSVPPNPLCLPSLPSTPSISGTSHPAPPQVVYALRHSKHSNTRFYAYGTWESMDAYLVGGWWWCEWCV